MRLPGFARRPHDSRSHKMVVVIECILNQNARDPGAASCPAMNGAVLAILSRHQVGVLQMPCPQMACLGLERSRAKGITIRELLDTPQGRLCCRRIAAPVADRIQEYLAHDLAVLAILGGDVGSPGCAVHAALPEAQSGALAEHAGVLMKALQEELGRRGLRESDPQGLNEDLAWLERTLKDAGHGSGPP